MIRKGPRTERPRKRANADEEENGMRNGKVKRILAAILAAVLAAALSGAAAADGGHGEAKAAAVGYLKAAVAEKCPVQTYETEDPLIASAADTDESAMAALALLSEGETEAAAKILDAMAAGMEADTVIPTRSPR